MRRHLAAAAFIVVSGLGIAAQNVTITPRLDTPQVRVYVATLQPRAPSVSKNGHATNRVIIYKGEQHEHRLNRVVLYLNDQTGRSKDDTRIAGAATHVEENTADTTADRIAVEIK